MGDSSEHNLSADNDRALEGDFLVFSREMEARLRPLIERMGVKFVFVFGILGPDGKLVSGDTTNVSLQEALALLDRVVKATAEKLDAAPDSSPEDRRE